MLYDLDAKGQTKMKGPAAGLDDFVSRRGENELFLVDNSSLYKLDMTAAEFSQVSIDYSVSHLNVLPKHDWLVMSEVDMTTKSAPRLHFFDPKTLADVKAVDMP